MAKKKRGSGSSEERRQTARRMVGLPDKWFAVAQELARKKPTPTVWFIVELIKREAEAAGVTDLPPPPWETEDR